MPAPVDKDRQHQTVKHRLMPDKSCNANCVAFADHRELSTTQRRLQAVADRGSSAQHIAQLQQCIDNSPSNQIMQSKASSLNAAPIQLISKAGVKQQLKTGVYLANFAGSFTTNHIALNNSGNMGAAEVHARRAPPPDTNTIITDATDLKNSLEAGTWVDRVADGWDVTSNTQIELQDTTKRNPAIAEDLIIALQTMNDEQKQGLGITFVEEPLKEYLTQVVQAKV